MGQETLPQSVETVVVGAGQAGLVMSRYLRQAAREHVVLDGRDRLGGGWLDRWDDFQLVTPNWVASLPDFPYDGVEPDGFMGRDEIAHRIARYAEVVEAPVVLDTRVERLTIHPSDSGFHLDTNRGPVEARDVVVATGAYHVPRIPAAAADLPARVAQVHSHDYRRESALPPGGVLVVGSGQSGVQLAEEFQDAGRRVVLSVGHCGRVPRRYRGRDIFAWLGALALRGAPYGLGLPTVDKLPDPRLRFAGNPHLSGHGGGHDTNLRRLAADGMTLVGHLEGADGERVRFAPDLPDNLRFADTFFEDRFRPQIDRFIELDGIDAPPDDREPFDHEPPVVTELDLAAEDIASVVWTSGYRLDFGWIDLPIFDEQGAPRHVRGVTEVPGLTFLGLPWQLNQASATLIGIVPDGRYLADRWR